MVDQAPRGEDATVFRRFDNWSPITEDDASIKAAIADANIPALMPALVHLTGDLSLLDGDIRPDATNFVDLQCGITEEGQAKARRMALRALTEYRDAGCPPTPPPNEDTIRKMLDWMIGVPLPDSYVEFLTLELSLHGENAYAQPGMKELDAQSKKNFHVVIIGAGMSGILAAYRLKEAGISYTVVDKNSEVGGTWFENSYPGCRVDSPNHTYSYSFVPNDWPMFFSPRPVLRDYFNRCATEFGIRDHIRLNTTVEAAAFDETDSRWQVHTVSTIDGSKRTLEANAVISAVGQLNRPRFPTIEGRENFSGPAFHSARWEHEHQLSGKRIAVIGTGASAFQFVPEIAKQAKEVRVFQRTPPWVRPTEDYHRVVPEGKHWLLNHVPYYAKWYRFLMFWLSAEGMLGASTKDPAWDNGGLSVSQANEELRQLLVDNVRVHLADHPELFAKCIPSYPPAGKRMLFDNGTWLENLKKDHVHLTTDPISRIVPSGVETQDGKLHEADVLIYGTGFVTSRMLAPMKIIGRGGAALHERWGEDDPRAYLGITVPDFPNFFCLYGPNTNIVVNGSIIFFSECEVRYVLGCLKLLIGGKHAAMDCKKEAHDAYNERIDEGNRNMAWGAPNVNSWYKNSKGRVTQNWPFSLVEFWQQTKHPDPADYRLS